MKAIINRSSNKFKYLFLLGMMLTLSIILFWKNKKSDKENSIISFQPNLNIPTPFSKISSGFYQDSLLLTIENPDVKKYKIFYTLDGSNPTLLSQEYSDPILLTDKTNSPNIFSNIKTSPFWQIPKVNVRKSHILRAVLVNNQLECGEELILNLIVNKDTSIKHLDIVSLIFNPDSFFGYHKGIYVMGAKAYDKDNLVRNENSVYFQFHHHLANYFDKGLDTERNVHFEFIPSIKHQRNTYSAPAKVRIHGFNSRVFPKKSIRVTLDPNKKDKPYDFFNRNISFHYPTLLLRNGGSDYLGVNFRDALAHSVLENSKMETSTITPVTVFLNGEYWGIHTLRNKIDRSYLAIKYQIPLESVTLLENQGILVEGDSTLIKEFKTIVENICKIDPTDTLSYSNIEKQINIESLIDMYIANIFFCNMDWPGNNIKFWRYNNQFASQNKRDEKWNWILYDMDMTIGLFNSSDIHTNILHLLNTPVEYAKIFQSLIKVDKFKMLFIQRFHHLLNTNLSTDNVIKYINHFEQLYQPVIEEDIIRWNKTSKKIWQIEVDKLKEFARKRPQIQADQLNEFFQLKGRDRITIKKVNHSD